MSLFLTFEKGLDFHSIQADADINGANAREHGEILENKAAVLLDPEQGLVKLTQAKVTPEAGFAFATIFATPRQSAVLKK